MHSMNCLTSIAYSKYSDILPLNNCFQFSAHIFRAAINNFSCTSQLGLCFFNFF